MSKLVFDIIELTTDQPEKYAVLRVDLATQVDGRLEGVVVALCKTHDEALAWQRDLNEGPKAAGGGLQ